MKSTTPDIPLIVPEIVGNALIAQDAFDARDSLVIDAAKIRTVVSGSDAQLANDTLLDLKTFLDKIELARRAVKAPVDALASEIQKLAKDLTTAAQAEYDRVKKLLGTYQLEQQRLANEAAEKARKEEQRILAEAEEKARIAQESGRGVEKKLEKIDAKAFEQVAMVRATAAGAAALKLTGISVRTEPAFEIEDIHALYKARPDLVKLDVDKTALKSYLKKFPKAELPGVRHWQEAATSVRR